ncbi:MAG: sll0787 family AIR synthase-like protein [Cyanobacteria bacterium P01_H01_bin.119]
MLEALADRLRSVPGIVHKRDIQTAAANLGRWVPHRATQAPILLGDDCAAIPDGNSYLLLAAEGLWPTLVETEPWFAGWCAVLVNISDIYAMGGRAIAVVDTLWSADADKAQRLWEGMMAASKAFNVPIVGGHTNCHSPYDALSVAILGRANRLLTSFNARPGDILMLVTDLEGQPHSQYPFWDAATLKIPAVLQSHLELLPQLAEAELCDTAKDISMGGIIGTALMLLEASRCGAVIDIGALPCPAELSLEQWLVSFPSYGFLLSVRPNKFEPIKRVIQQTPLICQAIGEIMAGHKLTLTAGQESVDFWDWQQQPLTGFADPSGLSVPLRSGWADN